MKKGENKLYNKIFNSNIKKVLLISIAIFLAFLLVYLVTNALTKNSFSSNSEINDSYYQNPEIIQVIEPVVDSQELATSSPISATTSTTTSPIPEKASVITSEGKYVKVIDSCDAHFSGVCVRARVCPSINCPVTTTLRNGMVLKTDGEITESDGIKWYHIIFDEWVRYSDRTGSEWYVSSEFLEEIDSYKTRYTKDAKIENLTEKKIIIDRSEQKLYAYDDEKLFMEILVSTGLDDLPTPRGTFHIFEKTPTRYMQGPLPGISDQYYDLPGVPWTMYFTYQGGAIHGAYWHDKFGKQWSHGCVNLVLDDAQKLYEWAPLGTTVIVRD